MRQVLEQSAVINYWSISEAFQPRSWATESPTVTSGLEHPDQSIILNEILAELEGVVRWREDWDGEGEDPAPEKPSKEAIDIAKQVVSELTGTVISKANRCTHRSSLTVMTVI